MNGERGKIEENGERGDRRMDEAPLGAYGEQKKKKKEKQKNTRKRWSIGASNPLATYRGAFTLRCHPRVDVTSNECRGGETALVSVGVRER